MASRRGVVVVAAGVTWAMLAASAAWGVPMWQRQTTPTPTGRRGQFAAVACPSSTTCFGVGYSLNLQGNDRRRLVERWDGASWSIVVTPAPAGGTEFDAVACASTSYCIAAGNVDGAPLIDRWNGANWATQSVPAISDAAVLGATCVSSSNCIIVGATGFDALILRWNGSTWTRQTAPAPPAFTYDVLQAVTCVVGSDCTAVGAHVDDTNTVIVEHWNGASWSRRTAPTVPGRDSQLTGVACIASGDCWAVGYSESQSDPTDFRRIAEHWNGASWSIVVTPAPSGPNSFTGISCAQSQCAAVGSIGQQPLADRWDDAHWTTESVTTLTNGADFQGVSCVSATTCVAAGIGFGGGTLIERRG
jgi:hypothetical protein